MIVIGHIAADRDRPDARVSLFGWSFVDRLLALCPSLPVVLFLVYRIREDDSETVDFFGGGNWGDELGIVKWVSVTDYSLFGENFLFDRGRKRYGCLESNSLRICKKKQRFLCKFDRFLLESFFGSSWESLLGLF